MAVRREIFAGVLIRMAGCLFITLLVTQPVRAQFPPAPVPDQGTIEAWSQGGAIYRAPGEVPWDEATLSSTARPLLPAFVLKGLSPRQLDAFPSPQVPFQIRLTVDDPENPRGWLTDAHLQSLSRFEKLVELQVNWSSVDDSTPLRRFGLLRQVRHLDLFGRKIVPQGDLKQPYRPEQLSPLGDLPALESLHFLTAEFDKNVEWLGRMKSLRSLELTGPSVTDVAMGTLNELTNLEDLTVTGARAFIRDSPEGLALMSAMDAKNQREVLIQSGMDTVLFLPSFTEMGSGLRRLRTLKLLQTEVTNSALAGIARLPGIQVLDLSGSWITGAGIANLSGMPELQTLNLGRMPASGANFPALPKLTRLDLSSSRVTDEGLQDFDRLPELRSLDLSRTGATLKGLRHADQLTKLGSLNLSESEVSPEGLGNVARLVALQSLDLSRTKIDSHGLKRLSSLKTLKHLNLSGAGLGRGIPVALAELEGLETLDLSRTTVTGAGLNLLAPLEGLHTLNLSETKLDSGGVEQLAWITSLTSLDLSRTRVLDEHVELLAPLTRLETLSLGGTRVTEGVLPALERFPRLATVDLTGCAVSQPELEAFRAAHPRIEIRNQ